MRYPGSTRKPVTGFGWLSAGERRRRFIRGAIACCRLAAHVELENPRNHDDGLRALAVFEHRKFQGLRPIHEQAAAEAVLILNHPVAAAVPADQEHRRFRATRRGRFVHDTSPLVWITNASTHDRQI